MPRLARLGIRELAFLLGDLLVGAFLAQAVAELLVVNRDFAGPPLGHAFGALLGHVGDVLAPTLDAIAEAELLAVLRYIAGGQVLAKLGDARSRGLGRPLIALGLLFARPLAQLGDLLACPAHRVLDRLLRVADAIVVVLLILGARFGKALLEAPTQRDRILDRLDELAVELLVDLVSRLRSRERLEIGLQNALRRLLTARRLLVLVALGAFAQRNCSGREYAQRKDNSERESERERAAQHVGSCWIAPREPLTLRTSRFWVRPKIANFAILGLTQNREVAVLLAGC
jgi:hypothetical protein